MRTQYWKAEAGRCVGCWGIVLGLGVTTWLLGGWSIGDLKVVPNETGAPVVQVLDDERITAGVKTKLFEDPLVESRHIHVDTRGGVVYMTGVVHSDAEKHRAVDLARSIEDVRDVRADLRLAKRTEDPWRT